jgi:hypothetical protein
MTTSDSIRRRVQMVGGIPDVLERFSALGFEMFEPSVSEFPSSGNEAVVGLLIQLQYSTNVSVFEISWSDYPSIRFACAFDHNDKSLFMSLEQYTDENSPVRDIFSPLGTLTKSSSFADNSGSETDSDNDTLSVTDFETEEENDLYAEVARSIAIALVDIAESLEAQKMSCLLDIGHPLFSAMMRTLLSAGFVVRSKSSKLSLKRRQQLLTFSIEQEMRHRSSSVIVTSPPLPSPSSLDLLEGVSLPPSVFDPLELE